MPGVAGLTRQVIRQHIGRNLIGSEFIVGSTTRAGGDANSVIDNVRLWGGDDTHNYKWIYATSGSNDQEIRRITDYTQGTEGTDAAGSHDATVATGFSATVPSGMTYELWNANYYPGDVNDSINRAINSVLGRYYKPEESFALHGDGKTVRFDLPSEMDIVNRVEYRAQVDGVVVHDCDSTFDETTNANITQALDSSQRKLGQSLKLTVAAGSSAGDVITASITSTDLSKYTHLEGWIRSSVALDAADWVIHLDNGVVQADGSDLESLNIPAASADTDTYFRVALAATENDTAIVSIGFEHNVDKGAHIVYFDDIRAVNHDSAEWVKIPKQTWRIDREGNDLVFKNGAPKYAPLKITGGSEPAQMTADTDTATVPEEYLIAKATALMLVGGSSASGDDPDGRRSLARDWERQALIEWGKFPVLVDARVA